MKRYQLPSPEEMSQMDAATIAAGISSVELMDRAGAAVLAAADAELQIKYQSGASALIFAGPGNNGGDGFVIARALNARGVTCNVVLAVATKYSAECLLQAQRFQSENGRLFLFSGGSTAQLGAVLPSHQSISDDGVKEFLQSAVVIFDCLLGTGQTAAPRGVIAELVTIINASTSRDSAEIAHPEVGIATRNGELRRQHPPLVAVDLPTGMNSESGELFDPHIVADLTVAVQLIKRGMLQSPGREACGRITAVDIGIDTQGGCEFSELNEFTVPKAPLRSRDAHKGDAGKVLVVGGCLEMPGAPILAATGALRSGAGLVTATQWGNRSASLRPLEIIDLPLSHDQLSLTDLSVIESAIAQADAIVLGPGIGNAAEHQKDRDTAVSALLAVILKSEKPAVIDADALNSIAQGTMRALSRKIIITPHPGEAGRLLNVSTAEVQRNRYLAARKLAQLTGAIVILKGASTVVYCEDQGCVNTSGNPWMATPGSGDLLTGIIATFLAQGMLPYDAAKRAVFAHGLAGDLAHRVHGGPITASDIAMQIPFALGKLQ